MPQHGRETLDAEHAQGLDQPEPVEQIVGNLLDLRRGCSIEGADQERHIPAHRGGLTGHIRMKAEPAVFRLHPEGHWRLTFRNLEAGHLPPEPFRDFRQFARRVEQCFEPGIPVRRAEARDELVEPHDL